jgi:hypothetical protein
VLLMPAKMNKAGQPAPFFPSRLAVFHSREILLTKLEEAGQYCGDSLGSIDKFPASRAFQATWVANF